jgi:hypothetical protein
LRHDGVVVPKSDKVPVDHALGNLITTEIGGWSKTPQESSIWHARRQIENMLLIDDVKVVATQTRLAPNAHSLCISQEWPCLNR